MAENPITRSVRIVDLDLEERERDERIREEWATIVFHISLVIALADFALIALIIWMRSR